MNLILGELSVSGNNGIFQSGISTLSGVFGNSSSTESTKTRNNDNPLPRLHLRFDASLQVPTADENRPVNLSVNYFVKINKECN